MNTVATFEEKIQKLPPELKQELENFLDVLVRSIEQPKKKYLNMKWRGALKDLRDQYTSVELQHKALEWWGD